MNCPSICELPPPPAGKTGWPWTDCGYESVAVPGATNPKDCQWPRISIVMPCMNAGQYIEEAIRSVLLQGYPDLEVLVFDGGSSDGTTDIIKKYAPWIACWVSEKDRGQSHAINKGLARSTGKLFNWFNADDIMCPGALLELATLHLTEKECVGVCGAMLLFDSSGKETVSVPVNGNKEQLGYWPDPYFLPQPSSLYDLASCLKVGGVNERLHYVMDMELVLKLSNFGKFAVTGRVMVRFRCHEGSKTIQGYYGGLLEMLSVNFALGQVQVADQVLRRRMDGHAKLVMGSLEEGDLAKLVDSWSYPKIVRYLIRRIWKNILLRVGCKKS